MSHFFHSTVRFQPKYEGILPLFVLYAGVHISTLVNYFYIFSEDEANDVDVKHFKFKMPALLAHLKKLAEQGQAPYYNIDILKYQVRRAWFTVYQELSLPSTNYVNVMVSVLVCWYWYTGSGVLVYWYWYWYWCGVSRLAFIK